MSMKPNYFKIGVFVIIAMALIFGAAVVFGAGLFAQDKVYFETYFTEAISGLNVGSPIELRGVNIGKVEKIAFVAKVYGDMVQRIQKGSEYGLLVVVVGSAPPESWQGLSQEQAQELLSQMVTRGLRMQVTSNLLTGQSYLQADYYDPEKFPPLEISWQPEHVYIPSIPSDLTTLREILNKLQKIDVKKVLDSLDKAINDLNIGEVSQQAIGLLSEAQLKVRALDTETLSTSANHFLASVDQTVVDANVPELSQQLQNFITEIRQTNKDLQKLLASPTETQSNIPEMIARINSALSRIDKLIANERPELEIILANFREISDNIKELTSCLKGHPSELLFSQPPSESEVLK
jgi:ABC-type transporter Mla subunit MlaD